MLKFQLLFGNQSEQSKVLRGSVHATNTRNIFGAICFFFHVSDRASFLHTLELRKLSQHKFSVHFLYIILSTIEFGIIFLYRAAPFANWL